MSSFKIKEIYSFDNKKHSSIYYQLSYKGIPKDDILKYIDLTDKIDMIKQNKQSIKKYYDVPYLKLKENDIPLNTYHRARSYLKLPPQSIIDYILAKRERKKLSNRQN